MSKSKFGKFMLLGAVTGAAISLFDRATREHVKATSKKTIDEVRFYSKHPEVLKGKFQEKTHQLQSIYEQIAGDASYIKNQVDELRLLTPQVKELVVNTKDAFMESKDEVQSIVKDSTPSDQDSLKKK